MKGKKDWHTPSSHELTSIGYRAVRLQVWQDIQGSNSKNSAKGEVEQIEGSNHHSTNPARILILEKAFATDDGDKSVDKKHQCNNEDYNRETMTFYFLSIGI